MIAAPAPVLAVTKGDTLLNVTANLISTDETGTGVVYTPQCLAECHLPVTLFYDGSIASAAITVNVSNRQNINWSLQNVTFGDDVQVSDVRVLQNLNITRNVTKYSSFNKTYMKLANDTIPSGCGELTSTSYWCLKPEPNGTTTITQLSKEWVSIKNELFSFNKSTSYYLDFVGKRMPRVGTASSDVIPSVFNFSFPDFAWWNTSWAACRNITASSSQATGFIHRVEILTTNMTYSKTLPNGNDLRIIPGNCSLPNAGAVEENFAIAYWNTTANSSILLINSSVNNNRYFAMYYNNSAAPRFWNITSTFYYKKRVDFNNETINSAPSGWGSNNIGAHKIIASDSRFDDKYINATDGQNNNGIYSDIIYIDNNLYPARWEFDAMYSAFDDNDVWGAVEEIGNHEFVWGIRGNGSSSCDGNTVRYYGQVMSTNVLYHVSVNVTGVDNQNFYINAVPMTNCQGIDSRDNTMAGYVIINGKSLAHAYIDNIVQFGSKNFTDLAYTISGEETNSTVCNGTLITTLLNPASNIEVQRNQTFSVKINVSCTGGCCGIVNATADPKTLILKPCNCRQ